jgi:plastocyanin
LWRAKLIVALVSTVSSILIYILPPAALAEQPTVVAITKNCIGIECTASNAPASISGKVIRGVHFDPLDLDCLNGTDKVVWTNNDTVDHIVAINNSSTNEFDSGTIKPSGSFSYVFTNPGNYSYSDKTDPGIMSGFIHVAKLCPNNNPSSSTGEGILK